MRLSISSDISGCRGSDNFLRRLTLELEKLGVRLVGSNDRSDINIITVSGSLKKRSFNVVRIDGVYYDVSRIRQNESIKRSITRADAVIFQSNWSKVFATRMLRIVPKISKVIYNGADPSEFDIPKIETGFKKTFVACAHWRPNKRLPTIVKAFLKAREILKENIGLIILGKSDIPKGNGVVPIGKVTQQRVRLYYASSNYCIHICHLDACPNSVVEALVSGLPVICNNIGGTPEIVGDSGVIVKLDSPFDFKPIKSMSSVSRTPNDVNILADGILLACNKSWNIKREDLFIQSIANQYLSFFKKCLEGK